MFCPPHCVTGFLLPDTGAGTNARHVSTTRVLLLCRWKERARLRVNMEKHTHAVQFLCAGMRLGIHMQRVLPADNAGVFVLKTKAWPCALIR